MNGGTTFHFLDASLAQALTQARQAAAGRDIRIGGGPSTIREFLAAGLIDYVHIVVVPVRNDFAGLWPTDAHVCY